MAKRNSTKAKTEPAAEEPQEPVTTPAATEDLTAMPFELYVVDATHGLNLRKAPRFGAKVQTILPNATEISVALGVDGPDGWLPVLENDSVCGWVYARYVKKIEE